MKTEEETKAIKKEEKRRFNAHKKSMEQQENSVHAQIDKLPEEQREAVLRTKRVIDLAFEDAKEEYTPDAMYAVDAFLRAHKLMGGSGRLLFIDAVKNAVPGKTFVFDHKSFYRSFTGTVMATNEYIYTIEKALLHKTEPLSFLGYLKLAFNTLFRRK